jgi:hypothetical protein
MSPDKEAELISTFPKLFEQCAWERVDSEMADGVQCEDGWFNLVWATCDHLPGGAVLTQLKQKHGLLRMSVVGPTETVSGLLDYARVVSGTTCELCGNSGELQGRHAVRCESCS